MVNSQLSMHFIVSLDFFFSPTLGRGSPSILFSVIYLFFTIKTINTIFIDQKS